MSKNNFFKINRKLIAAIFGIELFLCFAEAMRAINCHKAGGGECWSLFFAFIANIPASIAVESMKPYSFGIFQSFKIQTAITFIVYLAVGTVWWSIITHVLVFFYRYTSRFTADR